jgi:hypothetical protein
LRPRANSGAAGLDVLAGRGTNATARAGRIEHESLAGSLARVLRAERQVAAAVGSRA